MATAMGGEDRSEKQAVTLSEENISKERGTYQSDIFVLEERDIQFSKPGSSGVLVNDIINAFENDKAKTAAQKSEANVAANPLLLASKYIRENANTGLMVVGTVLTIVSVPVPGALPIVIATVGTVGVMGGAVSSALDKAIKTKAMQQIMNEQKRILYERTTESRRQELEKQAREKVEADYDQDLDLQMVKRLGMRITVLTNEVLQFESRKDILDIIGSILNLSEMSAEYANDRSDFGRFERFKESQQENLKKLNDLLDTAQRLDPNFKFDGYQKIIGFNDFKKYLNKLKKNVSENTGGREENQSGEDIKNKIKAIREKIESETHKAKLLLKTTVKGVKVDEQWLLRVIQNGCKAEFETLFQSITSARHLGFLSTIPQKLDQFKNMESLNGYLMQFEQEAVRLTTSKRKVELTDIKQKLAKVVEEKLTIEGEKDVREKLEQKKILFDSEVKKGTQDLEKEYDSLWTTNLKATLANAKPIAVVALAGIQQLTSTMSYSLGLADTTPTAVAADVTAKVQQSAKADGDAAADRVAFEVATAVADVASSRAAVSEATAADVVLAVREAAASHTSSGARANGANAVVAAAEKAAAVEGASAISVAAAAVVATYPLQAKANNASAFSATTKNELNSLRARPTVSDIKQIMTTTKIVADILTAVCAAAEQSLKQSEAQNDVRFWDLSRLEDVCSRYDSFKSKKSVLQKVVAPGEWFGLTEEFKPVMNSLTVGQELKAVMLEIMKINLHVEGTEKTKLGGYGKFIAKPPEDILKELNKSLSYFGSKPDDDTNNLSQQLDALQVYFPPDDNPGKERFMLMADQDQVDCFKNILNLKKIIIVLNMKMKTLTPDQKESLKNSKELTEWMDTVEAVGKSIKRQSDSIDAQERINERYRKPYVNVFGSVDDPVIGLQDCIKRAQFSDLLPMLTVNNLKEFVRVAKDRGVKSQLVQDFCDLYSDNIDEEALDPKIIAERLQMMKKIFNPPDAPITEKHRKGLNELQDLWNRYLTNGTRIAPWAHSDFQKSDGTSFSNPQDFKGYIKHNEQLYHSQRVLGIQETAIVDSMGNDLKETLGLINQQLGTSFILNVEVAPPSQTPVSAPSQEVQQPVVSSSVAPTESPPPRVDVKITLPESPVGPVAGTPTEQKPVAKKSPPPPPPRSMLHQQELGKKQELEKSKAEVKPQKIPPGPPPPKLP